MIGHSIPRPGRIELEANGKDHEHRESLAEGAVEDIVEESAQT